MRRFSIVMLPVLAVACCGTAVPAYGDPLTAATQEKGQEQTARLPRQPLSYNLGDCPPKLEVNRWTDGRQHSLDEFRGNVVVIEFTGMWCGVCRKSAPTMQRLVEHYQDQGVVFFGIHTPTEDDKGVAKMISDDGFPQLMAIDERIDASDKFNFDGKTAAGYGTIRWPTLVVLDRQGRVAFSGEILDRTMTAEKIEPLYIRCAARANMEYPMPKDLSESAKSDWIRRLSFEFHREWIDKALNIKP